jgi:hypothetical protein
MWYIFLEKLWNKLGTKIDSKFVLIVAFYLFLSLLYYRKQQLMQKFQADNRSFSPERVEEEVDRFMMDAESVNMYIKYLKDRKTNPEKYANEALEAELSLSNPKTVRITLFGVAPPPVLNGRIIGIG